MGAPILNGPFTMPMFRAFVPRKLQPWIYIFFAVSFQLSGGLYLGSLNPMIGSTALMRDDLQMCLYANLAGMAIYFPLLFRMKFRFYNKNLLMAAATGVLLCNLAAPHITFLPLLWAVCFLEGICKIQGTFECMSNIQLWMTPKRDFGVFFPFLHIIILGSMQAANILSAYFVYYYEWAYMHLFIAGLMLIDLLVLQICTRPFRPVKKFPLYGIDWLGALLWATLLLEIAYFLTYGDWYDWWNSPVIRQLAVVIVITLLLCIGRMLHIRHPFLEPRMWTYRNLFPLLLLIAVVEALLATEHVLEEIFMEEVMHYGSMDTVPLKLCSLSGVLAGCLFSYWWLHKKGWRCLHLVIAGLAVLSAYLLLYYFTISADISMSLLYAPNFCRSFAYAVLSATLMVCLEKIVSFQHFFQALSVFNMLHMVVGSVLGAALYTQGFSHYITDNMARYGMAVDGAAVSRWNVPLDSFLGEFVPKMMETSIKQVYGWVIYACLLLLLLLLFYDSPLRRDWVWKQEVRKRHKRLRRLRTARLSEL